jgi:hypothetical protein
LHRSRILSSAERECNTVADFLVGVILEGNKVWLAPPVSKMAQCGDRHGQDMEITIMSHEIEERVAAFLGKYPLRRTEFRKNHGAQRSPFWIGRSTQSERGVQNVARSSRMQNGQGVIAFRQNGFQPGVSQRGLNHKRGLDQLSRRSLILLQAMMRG